MIYKFNSSKGVVTGGSTTLFSWYIIMNMKTIASRYRETTLFTHWRDFLELCKPKVVLLLVFTAVVGMVLSTPGMIPLQEGLFGILGIALAAASAAAINHVLDQKSDAKMSRTSNRPIPTGHLTTSECLIFAGVLGVISMLILILLVNLLTALLTFISLIGYAVVYTIYLKRATPQNIVIGGAAGAMPPVLGWAAITGEAPIQAWLLFLIVFVWTPPHFWALAIHRLDDYTRVNIPMLPVTHGVEFTRFQILLYTILLIVVTALPYLIGMAGMFYLIGAMALGGAFLVHVILLMNPKNEKQPIKTFVFSIQYIMGLFAVLLIDHYLPLVMNLFS